MMRVAVALIAVVTTIAVAASSCPDGWTGDGTKCMMLLIPETHEACAEACGSIGGSLACIQTEADNNLAARVSPADLASHVWVGEYQWPFETEIRFGFACEPDCFATAPYNGQPHWGQCTNGQATNYTPSRLAFMQPNNNNAGEDCMSRSPVGFGDDVCTRKLPCLCEWGSQTSSLYLSVHGPALTQRAHSSTAYIYGNLRWTVGLAAAVGSIPAICLVLLTEGYYVRWRQRMAPTSPAEAALQATIRLALRRRMLQAGLPVWIGGVLFGMGLPSQPLFGMGAWPYHGCCEFPTGAPILWAVMRHPGILLILMSIRPSDEVAIRIAAVFWSCYVAVAWWYNEENQPFWRLAPRPTAAKYAIFAARGLGLVLSLVSAIFWRRHALPSRLALRWLWICVRLEILLAGLDFLIDSLPYLETPFKRELGDPMVAAGAITIAFALVVTAPVRRRMLGALGNLSSRESSAATVVQTMVRGDAIEAIRTAQAHFYCIRISALGEADMANNQDSGLFAKTDKASMGECDAFISHSWRDDPALKWQRMLEFKAEFESKSEGREPQCWLDKACINQAGDIDASLKALPIFLLSSRHFCCFVGDTYFSRMWCMLELFTFVRSGGAIDRIVLKPLSVEGSDVFISKLDVRLAGCFLRQDKQRILAIVESSYGSSSEFNAACRQILVAADPRASKACIKKSKVQDFDATDDDIDTVGH